MNTADSKHGASVLLNHEQRRKPKFRLLAVRLPSLLVLRKWTDQHDSAKPCYTEVNTARTQDDTGFCSIHANEFEDMLI